MRREVRVWDCNQSRDWQIERKENGTYVVTQGMRVQGYARRLRDAKDVAQGRSERPLTWRVR